VDVDRYAQKELTIAPTLVAQARGILVFPKVVKGGFLVGGEYGEGALRLGGQTVSYYNIAAVSYGLQAGPQEFGYALVFMADAALQYLERSEGFEIGVGPSIVVDEGVAKTLTSTTAREDVYTFIFGQEGLMGGWACRGRRSPGLRASHGGSQGFPRQGRSFASGRWFSPQRPRWWTEIMQDLLHMGEVR